MSTIKGPLIRLILTVSLWAWGPVCAENTGLNWGVHRAGNFRRLILKKSLEPMFVPWCHKIDKNKRSLRQQSYVHLPYDSWKFPQLSERRIGCRTQIEKMHLEKACKMAIPCIHPPEPHGTPVVHPQKNQGVSPLDPFDATAQPAANHAVAFASSCRLRGYSTSGVPFWGSQAEGLQ